MHRVNPKQGSSSGCSVLKKIHRLKLSLHFSCQATTALAKGSTAQCWAGKGQRMLAMKAWGRVVQTGHVVSDLLHGPSGT